MTRHNDPIIAGMKGELLRLAEENEYLRAENEALVQRMGYGARQNQALIEECDRLRAENEYLRAENTALKAMNDSLLADSATLQENRITRRHATHPIT